MSNVAKFDASVGGAYIQKTLPVAGDDTYVVTVGVAVPAATLAVLLAAELTSDSSNLVGMQGASGGGANDSVFLTYNGGSVPGWAVQTGPSYGVGVVPADSWLNVSYEAAIDSGTNWLLTVDGGGNSLLAAFSYDLTVGAGAALALRIGAWGLGSPLAGEIYYMRSVVVKDGAGTTIFSDDFAGGFASWDVVVGDASVVADPFTPPASIPFESAYWRFVVGDLATFEVLSFLDRIASSRTATYTLNQPAVATGKVPADNPEINIDWPAAGDDPFLAEGTRVLWGLRREGGSPVWTIRFAGILQQFEDDAQSDNAYTTYTAWDPWHYLFNRPVCNADGSLPGPDGISFTATRVDVIAATLLKNTIANNGVVGIDAGVTYGGTAFYAGTIAAAESIDINFPQGTTVGQAWQQLCDANYCDIILDPIYDPVNRPGYLVEFNIYSQAGQARDDAIFAWDMPSRSLVGLHRLVEGSKRANKVKFFAGQGGSAPGGQTIPIQDDAASVAKYGEYWLQVFLPNQTVAAAVEALAQAQLQLSKNGETTVTFSPAPQRSPIPFQDYFLGDRVPVYASRRFRQQIPNETVESSDNANYQRVYGIPIVIADDATEQIQQMLTSIPTGAA